MTGTLANALAIILGGAIGILIKKQMPKKISDSIMQAMAIGVLYVGINGVIKGNNTLIIIISLALAALIGSLFDFDAKINKCVKRIESKFGSKQENLFTEGFITSALMFCIGAMGIIGALQSGIKGNNDILYTKAVIDFAIAVIFASSFGAGVMFSSVPLFIYFGSIVLLAQWASPYLSEAVIADMTGVGSLLIIALGLNLLKVTNIKVMNYILAIFFPVFLNLFIK